LCTNFIRAHSLFTLAFSPAGRFFHRRDRHAAQREKIPHPPHTRLRNRLSKWAAQRETFERARAELPGGAVELDSARGRPKTCTVCNNSDSRSLLAHPHFFFRAPFPLTVGACRMYAYCALVSRSHEPCSMELIRFLFANIGHSPAYYHLVNVEGKIEGIIRPVDRGVCWGVRLAIKNV
jgi:hypothetical protein